MDLNIRNVAADDFMGIASLAEKCGTMSTMPNAVYHLFIRYFKKDSYLAQTLPTIK